MRLNLLQLIKQKMEDGSMKRFLTITLAAVLFFCAGCSKQTETKAPDTSVIAQKYAPESSIAVLRFYF
jgi:PBP1b-binding outer membrane lipoprotein LpoB